MAKYVQTQCGIEGCNNRYAAQGRCTTHYMQGRADGTIKLVERDGVCPRCKTRPRHVGPNGRVRPYCSPCRSERDRERYAAMPGNRLPTRPETVRRNNLKTKYGITPDQYDEMFEAQGGKCALCQDPHTHWRRMPVDHDHACCPGARTCGQCIRGLLCSNCNTGLGSFRDDPVRLRAAVDYLMRGSRA